jgi:nitrogen fixation protein FixH
MKKTGLVALTVFAAMICVATVATAKGAHAMTISGTVSAVDQNAKTFSLKDANGKETPITWTTATRVRGGSLKDGERANVSVLQKDGKNVATSIRIASAKTMAKPS